MNLNLLSSDEEQIDLIIKSITNSVHTILSNQSKVTVAVSGGKSPIALFKKLSLTNLPWDKIIITLVDERIIDTSSEDSNENLVKTYLLQNLATRAHFNGLVLPEKNVTQMLDNAKPWVEQIDIAILGMGNDGHTASIFPECNEFLDAINLNLAPAYIITTPISAKYTRIGLNLSALTKIKHLILSASGDTKLNILKEAQKGNNPNYPISYLLKQRPDMHIYLA